MRAAVILGLVAASAPIGRVARAAPWALTVESGGEVDSNVQRVETGPGLDAAPVCAPVTRLGVRADGRGALAGGSFAASVGALARVVLDPAVQVEDVALLTADLRYLHPIRDRPLSLGAALLTADAEPLADPIGARTFRNLGADALLALRGDDDRRLTLALGGRDFTYKPDHDLDWRGPVASVRLDLPLWTAPAPARSLELATTAALELRGYDSHALADACPPGARPNPTCSAPTSITRRDQLVRLGAELTYAGPLVLTGGYQLTLIRSNSFGQSLARHRATVAATVALPAKLFASAIVIAQLDQYLDGLVVARDLQHMEFQSLEDENRSSLQLRLARALSPTWSIEARLAIWRNLATTDAFDRTVGSLGLIYAR